MMLRSKILLALNKLFPAPVHPFNLQNEGKKSYGRWQYENGEKTIKFYLKNFSAKDMFLSKTVVDVGCGAAGKSLYYAFMGALHVYGIEILEKYRTEAEALAKELGLQDKFSFVAADSAAIPFPDNFADTVIVNDAMEHVSNPEKTIQEILRILKKGGKAFINFPPYYHPMGAHLTDAIYIPWVHLLFPEKVLIESYRTLTENLPDGEDRINFRISKREDGSEYFSYINKMTIKRFRFLLEKLSITPLYYHEEPLRSIIAPLSKLPVFNELFTKMVVCVIEKR
jgi:ubiquinone/menaquinone biosynthesis C-methylase UbiE